MQGAKVSYLENRRVVVVAGVVESNQRIEVCLVLLAEYPVVRSYVSHGDEVVSPRV